MIRLRAQALSVSTPARGSWPLVDAEYPNRAPFKEPSEHLAPKSCGKFDTVSEDSAASSLLLRGRVMILCRLRPYDL